MKWAPTHPCAFQLQKCYRRCSILPPLLGTDPLSHGIRPLRVKDLSKSFTMRFWSELLPALTALVRICTSSQTSTSTTQTCSPDELDILSCSSESLTANSCCVESPGGLLVQTQLYNWNPGLGPEDSWTIHGLWPDYCNGMVLYPWTLGRADIRFPGSYPSSCDPSRSYTDLPKIFDEHKLEWLKEYFESYWKVRRRAIEKRRHRADHLS
jgi:hypothetical protein